ncbi:MAG: hypothetical protein HYT39_03595 [Candidatus Sungbacteria bacterium]|nr:hypothetical protein [Candidatus Sungbacteria bacterium]
MKTSFIIAAIVVSGYIGFRYLPPEIQKNIKAKAQNAMATVGLSNFSPDKLLPPLKAKITPIAGNIAERIKPDNPVEKRAEIIDKLEKEIQVIAQTPAPKTAKEREILQSAVGGAKVLIQELKEENPKNGVIVNAVSSVLNAVLPDSAPKNETVCQNH